MPVGCCHTCVLCRAGTWTVESACTLCGFCVGFVCADMAGADVLQPAKVSGGSTAPVMCNVPQSAWHVEVTVLLLAVAALSLAFAGKCLLHFVALCMLPDLTT